MALYAFIAHQLQAYEYTSPTAIRSLAEKDQVSRTGGPRL